VTSVRLLAAALAADLATGYRYNLTGRTGRPVERLSLEPPRTPLPADVYRPAGLTPVKALLLVHGLATEGKDDARLRRFAEGFARAGLLVIVPEIAEFRLRRISPTDVQAASNALRTAVAIAGDGVPIAAGSFSYAVGPLLVAAAEPEFSGRIGSLFAFGGFFDLRNVFTFALTGRHEFLGEKYEAAPDPFVRRLAAGFVLNRFGGEEREKLGALIDQDREAILRACADPGLSLRARHFARALVEEDPVKVIDLIRKIDNGILLDMWKVSPASVIPSIPGKVVLAHSTADSLVPFTESQRLHHALRGRGPCTLALLRSWSHVDRAAARGRRKGGGAMTVYRVMREVLAPGRPAGSGRIRARSAKESPWSSG